MLNTSTYLSTLDGAKIIYISPNELIPYKNNARMHSKKQINQIALSIKEFGFTNPVLIDDNNNIIAGHGRVLAAKQLGMDKVPTICIRNLTEAQIKAYIIADNKIAENARWDMNLLAIELQNLSDLGFDTGLTGYEIPEIDLIIKGDADDDDPDDDVIEPEKGPAVTKPGDVYQLDKHLLICGDALKPETYKALMGEDKAHVIFTDPPYNVQIDGNVCGKGKIKHKEFAMASGEMSDPDYSLFLKTTCAHMAEYSVDGSLHYICMDWRHIDALIVAGKSVYTELKNICVWNKSNGGMGTMYRSKHEFVAVFKHGAEPHINNIQLGKYGRYRTNVWDYPGINSFHQERLGDLEMHPTVKPVALVADAIRDCTKRGQIVLDPFAGSGTTLIAAERTGRIARCLEIDPHYCDVIIRRWQKLTGKQAVNLITNKTFNQTQGE